MCGRHRRLQQPWAPALQLLQPTPGDSHHAQPVQRSSHGRVPQLQPLHKWLAGRAGQDGGCAAVPPLRAGQVGPIGATACAHRCAPTNHLQERVSSIRQPGDALGKALRDGADDRLAPGRDGGQEWLRPLRQPHRHKATPAHFVLRVLQVKAGSRHTMGGGGAGGLLQRWRALLNGRQRGCEGLRAPIAACHVTGHSWPEAAASSMTAPLASFSAVSNAHGVEAAKAKRLLGP